MKNDREPAPPVWDAPVYTHKGGSRSLSAPALVGLTREILDRGVPLRFSAPGTSMSPFIRDGDIITIAPFKAAACRPGDVVAFVRPGTTAFVVHRVVAVSGAGCRIKGDNSPEEDGDIPYSCITGQVIRVERAGKVVRLGLGPERAVVALLSKQGWLRFFVRKAASVCSAARRLS